MKLEIGDRVVLYRSQNSKNDIYWTQQFSDHKVNHVGTIVDFSRSGLISRERNVSEVQFDSGGKFFVPNVCLKRIEE